MNRTEAKTKIEDHITAILKIAGSLAPSDLAALIGGTRSSVTRTEKTASSSDDSASKKATKGAKAKKSAKVKTEKKAETSRKYTRRDPAEIERLRKGVLTALQGAEGFIPASKIAAVLTMSFGRTVTGEELSFPIAFLREHGYVAKKGEKVNAKYGCTTKGKAFTGEFPAKPAKPDADKPAKPDADAAKSETSAAAAE